MPVEMNDSGKSRPQSLTGEDGREDEWWCRASKKLSAGGVGISRSAAEAVRQEVCRVPPSRHVVQQSACSDHVVHDSGAALDVPAELVHNDAPQAVDRVLTLGRHI